MCKKSEKQYFVQVGNQAGGSKPRGIFGDI